MANYVFETMTQDQAASFTASDYLIFLNGTASSVSVADTAGTPLTNESITLTSGSKSLSFLASALSDASTSSHLLFSSGSDYLGIGYSGDQTLANNGVDGSTARLYGFGGDDLLNGSGASDTLFGGAGVDSIAGVSVINDSVAGTTADSDYLFGGGDGDSIVGGDGNDHIYGYDNFSAASLRASDGDDTINAGAGNDYVNGNGGADSIFGGTGNDHIYGGSGDDTVIGGTGWDYIQGNLGADSLIGGVGNDTIRGGQGDDVIYGGTTGTDADDTSGTGGVGTAADSLLGDAGNDTIYGGVGNDTIYGGDGADSIFGGAGHDVLNGGAGNDVFVFASGDASFVTTGSSAFVGDEIVDYVHGTDHLAIANYSGLATGDILVGSSGATFTTVSAARDYAQGLLNAHTSAGGHEVAAVTVGSDTYLFYVAAGGDTGTIDSVIKFDGAVTFTTADFVTA